jgi:hypothetical protein
MRFMSAFGMPWEACCGPPIHRPLSPKSWTSALPWIPLSVGSRRPIPFSTLFRICPPTPALLSEAPSTRCAGPTPPLPLPRWPLAPNNAARLIPRSKSTPLRGRRKQPIGPGHLPSETEGRRSAIGRSDSLAPSPPDVALIADRMWETKSTILWCPNEALRGALEAQKSLTN